jgi:hypothetical protein
MNSIQLKLECGLCFSKTETSIQEAILDFEPRFIPKFESCPRTLLRPFNGRSRQAQTQEKRQSKGKERKGRVSTVKTSQAITTPKTRCGADSRTKELSQIELSS